jgi:hypothetical protein
MTLKLVVLAAASSRWIEPPASAAASAGEMSGRHGMTEVMRCT